MSKVILILILFAGFLVIADEQPNENRIIKLPAPDFKGNKTLYQALSERKSSRNFSEKDLTLQEIANILWSAWGVNRSDGRRTAPSARNAQDIEVYAVLKDGIYLYDAVNQQLVLQAEGDFRKAAGTQEYVWKAPLNIIYVSNQEKLAFVKEQEATPG